MTNWAKELVTLIMYGMKRWRFFNLSTLFLKVLSATLLLLKISGDELGQGTSDINHVWNEKMAIF